jgi:hypothetical protein
VPTLFGQAFYGRPGATGALLAQAVICLVVIILGYAAS